MEQDSPAQDSEKSKSRYWKFVLGFFAVIIGVFILYVIGFWAVRYYEKWQAERALDRLVQAMKQDEDADYRRAMADTYGGKTPQETLQMYIDAVEKGDYELAGKYFIGDYQEKATSNLNISSKKKIQNSITLLKESIKSSGGYYPRDYMSGGQEFIIENPVYIRMRLYPNAIWKIIEI